ncbi:MAG: hypothetical protein ACFCUV_26745 [Rivularia sp. (in: cyanobacteria)]
MIIFVRLRNYLERGQGDGGTRGQGDKGTRGQLLLTPNSSLLTPNSGGTNSSLRWY